MRQEKPWVGLVGHVLRPLVRALTGQGLAYRLAPQIAKGAAHPPLHPLDKALAEAAVEGWPVGGRREELEAKFSNTHAGPGFARSGGSRARVARVHEHDEPVGLVLAAKAFDVVHEVQGCVVGWRNFSIGWQEVEVAVLGHLLTMSDDGKEESRFIVCGPLER